jgi:hypothetical protein
VDCDDIQDGYADDIGSGLQVAIRYARQHGAWVDATRGRGPLVGDVVQVLGPMHVATVIGWDTPQPGWLRYVSVDGGQVDPTDGLQRIDVRTRDWADGPRPLYGGRLVDGWIDVARLPLRGT